MVKKRMVKKENKNSSLQKKISVSSRNLFIFLVLFAISLALYNISSTNLFLNLFGMLSILFGFLTLALFIVLMVFLILKSGQKK